MSFLMFQIKSCKWFDGIKRLNTYINFFYINFLFSSSNRSFGYLKTNLPQKLSENFEVLS